MAVERTLSIIKPDAVAKNVIGEIYSRFEKAGLKVIAARMMHLSQEEAEALPLLARGAALRFMLTRLYDWLNTPEGALVVRKDPLEYVRKMRFHRSVRDASDYGLAP